MELTRTAADLRATCDGVRAAGGSVGLVPTMGALHAGHASLIRRARNENESVAVSIFVNPLQFGPTEDLERYPRDEARDATVAAGLGVDQVFAPSVDEMYPDGEPVVRVDPGAPGERLEGAARPGHFAGVLTVVAKLLHAAGPCRVYFGEKDAQQLFLVRRMVRDLGFPAEVRDCPTVREADGVALSSRNGSLSAPEREAAGCLFLALSEAAEMARGGERDAGRLVAVMAREIGATALARLDYAAVVDEASFEEVRAIEGRTRALVAARFGSTRLIDNLRLPAADARVGATPSVTG